MPVAPVRRSSRPLLDPGWLFLIAGVALVAVTVIIPAMNDLEEAKFYKHRLETVQKHRADRLANYSAYLGSLQRGDENLLSALAATQLNKAPEHLELLDPASESPGKSVSIFPALEPPPLVLPTYKHEPRSTLERWATDDRSRLWLLAGGAMCILIGLLPPTTRRA